MLSIRRLFSHTRLYDEPPTSIRAHLEEIIVDLLDRIKFGLVESTIAGEQNLCADGDYLHLAFVLCVKVRQPRMPG